MKNEIFTSNILTFDLKVGLFTSIASRKCMLLQPCATYWMALPFNNSCWNYGRKSGQISLTFDLTFWPFTRCDLKLLFCLFLIFSRNLIDIGYFWQELWAKNEIFRDWSLTFDVKIWPLTSSALLVYLSFPFLPSFQIYLVLAILAWRNSWFSDILRWPLTSKLTFDPFCHTIFFPSELSFQVSLIFDILGRSYGWKQGRSYGGGAWGERAPTNSQCPPGAPQKKKIMHIYF